MRVELFDTVFDPWQAVKSYQAEKSDLIGKFGATATFVGTMRDFNEGKNVDKMMLEHYPGMTERQLIKIAEIAQQRWNILDTLIIHRVGEIMPNDAIVVVAIWSSHRGSAFDACRFVMEELKSNAPFWKKEQLETEKRWVAKNTDG